MVPDGEQSNALYCDKSGVVANSKQPRSYMRSKHIERKYNLIIDIMARGNVEVKRISTHDNIADPFTKALSSKLFDKHV